MGVVNRSTMSRSASPSRKAKKTPEPESSPISREEVSGQMQDIFSMVKALRDEKDGLIAQLEQMELRNEADNKRYCKEISKSIRDIDGLQEIFVKAADGVNAKSAYGIPEVSETAKRLRMHFARLNGKFLDMCWRGWRKFVTEKKLAAMGEGERFKRLKTFLGAKLKGIKYAVFHAICCEARDQKKAQMMNSDKLKKVACYLEMICRGIVQRVFGAMKRYKFMAKQMRDEEERLRALLMEKHSQSMQRLKIFLMGKEKRMMYGGFRWWQNCTVNSKFGIMEREVSKARAARLAAEEECAKLKGGLSNDGAKSSLGEALAAAQQKKTEAQAALDSQAAEIAAAKAKLAELKEILVGEKAGRKDDKLETARLLEELSKINADKADLEAEMALIVDKIGFLSEYSSKKAK